MSDSDKELYRSIGKLEAGISALTEANNLLISKIEKMDGRVRKIEMKAAVFGAVGGGVFAVVITYAKSLFTGGSGN